MVKAYKRQAEIEKLPAFGIADEVNDRLKQNGSVVVTAPPGAGKSTVLPLTILNEWGNEGKILVLEPRRVAAKHIAERMAYLAGEEVGESVGYRVRFESRISKATRVEVITEGILTRMIVDDPTLDGVSVVVFDEFHERSITSDVALAMIREAQQIIRPDIKIVIMSATIDASFICSALNAPLVQCEGKMFPVDIVRVGDCDVSEVSTSIEIADAVKSVVVKAFREQTGDILVFLPGQAEILMCEKLLNVTLPDTRVYKLYGSLSPQQQSMALSPSKGGERRVVLATPIAETSLTIEGVRVVVDSGLCRTLVYNQRSGLSNLETVRISKDMADQRAGRAGRIEAGVCYRMWSVATEHRMNECRSPEILYSELSSVLLDVSAWGGAEIRGLQWLTPPPTGSLISAEELLKVLGAIGDDKRITQFGRRIANVPCHPRIAAMLLSAESPQMKALAADVAAILEEKDPLADGDDIDMNSRVVMLREQRRSGRMSRVWERVNRVALQYRKIVDVEEDNSITHSTDCGYVMMHAFPERIAKADDKCVGEYLLARGDRVSIHADNAVCTYKWLSIASLHSHHGKGRVFLCSPLDEACLTGMVKEREYVAWNSREGAVNAVREKRIGQIVIDSQTSNTVNKEDVLAAVCKAASKEGDSMFDFASDDLLRLQRRVQAVASWAPELELPDVDKDSLVMTISDWLPFYIDNARTSNELKKINMKEVVWSRLSYEQQKEVDRRAPSHIVVPTGSKIKVDYRVGAEAPIVSVRLQECFGLNDTPRVNDDEIPVLMELLSPGYKPVQLTQDLRSFWNGTYFEVKKELKRRYPKHYWPDNPLEAEAVKGVKRK